MNAVLACLPWAAVLRIIVACWVFSNPGGFDYESAFDPSVSSFTASYGPSVQGYLPAWIESRLIRTNVFPLILLLLLILLVKMIILIYKIAPLSIGTSTQMPCTMLI